MTLYLACVDCDATGCINVMGFDCLTCDGRGFVPVDEDALDLLLYPRLTAKGLVQALHQRRTVKQP